MAFGSVAKLAGGGVNAPDLLGDHDGIEIGAAAQGVGVIDEPDLQLAADPCEGQALAGWDLPWRSASVARCSWSTPSRSYGSLRGTRKRPACGEHVVDELLRHRDVGLAWDRWFRSVDPGEIFATHLRDLGRPRRAAARGRHEPMVA